MPLILLILLICQALLCFPSQFETLSEAGLEALFEDPNLKYCTIFLTLFVLSQLTRIALQQLHQSAQF